MLTTEFIEGIKVSDRETLKLQGIKLADLDHKLFEAFSEQIFYTGFVHADPHPGNSKWFFVVILFVIGNT